MEKDRYIYQIVLEHNHPVVELNYLVKSSPVLMCVLANEDNSEKESSTPVVEVDLQTGEIIENALGHYFGFDSFRSLQRETNCYNNEREKRTDNIRNWWRQITDIFVTCCYFIQANCCCFAN